MLSTLSRSQKRFISFIGCCLFIIIYLYLNKISSTLEFTSQEGNHWGSANGEATIPECDFLEGLDDVFVVVIIAVVVIAVVVVLSLKYNYLHVFFLFFLIVGMCDGMGFGQNTAALLVTRGCYEMTRLAVAMGAKPHTLAGLSGIGGI